MLSSPYLIERIILSNHQQFAHCDIDLCHPGSNEPMRECCFIGVNGTGKTDLLKALYRSISRPDERSNFDPEPLVLTKIRTSSSSFYQLQCDVSDSDGDILRYHVALEEDESWQQLAETPFTVSEFVEVFQDYRYSSDDDPGTVQSDPEYPFTAFFSPSETLVNGKVSEGLTEFLADLNREREAEFFSFLKQADNRSKTVEEAEVDFLQESPNILMGLKEIWDKMIVPSGLSFQAEGGGRLVANMAGAEVNFSNLSTALRCLLFKTGQVYRHYFRKNYQPGFLFLIEPETSLHPELQFNLINLYRSILSNHPSQLFVSTHSPLIATQFSEHSRILLNLESDGTVRVTRGKAPQGGDLNQILMKDFGLKTVKPQERSEPTGDYSKLKRAIRESDEQEDELADLIDQVVTIRRI